MQYARYRNGLSDVFTNSYGKAKAYLQRVLQVFPSMEAGKYNISEIAFKVGINNLFYFRQCFKEEFGCIPSEYLKRLKETGEK